ncbi:MAG: STAS domain-containing protein [Phycisphaerae bacterium]|nr:STAS domain-containing protein [Phycisphaerae bacterium]
MQQQEPRLSVSVEDGVSVVRFVDEKILDEMSISEIGRQLEALVNEASRPRMVLDFSGVSHMSSSALGMLITLHKHVREKDGDLRLASIQPEIYEVFVITRLNDVFRIHDAVSEALESLT